MVTEKKQKITRFLKENRFFFLFLLINIIAHWKLLLLKTQLAYGDFAPTPLSTSQALNTFWYSWNETGFGIYRQLGNFTFLITSLLIFIFRSPLLAQKVFILLVPTISFFSFNYLLKKHIRVRSDVARFISSLFYTFCPVALGEFVGGSIYSTVLVFALLPLLFSSTLSLIKHKSIRKIFLHGLLLGIVFSTYTQSIVLYFSSLVILFLYDLLSTKLKAFKRWFVLFYTGIIAALINPIALITSFNNLRDTSTGNQVSSFVDSTSQFLMEMHITYADNPLTSIIRMGSIGGFGYNFVHFWTIPFFIVVVFVT